MTVHVVEPGGRGGVHQHAAAVAAALAAQGVPVAFHTAADAERGRGGRPCFWRFESVRVRLVRRPLVVGGWLLAGVPSILAAVRPGDVVHVEGWFRPALFAPLVEGARRRGARVVLSPHTTFSRRGRPREEAVVAWMARRSSAVLAFSGRDAERIEGWGASAWRARLLVDAPAPDPVLVDHWRGRWGARQVVLSAGQIRPDKGLDGLVRAMAGSDLLLAVVGEDLGALGPARRLAAQLGVALDVEEGYQPIDHFVAAVAAADVVACPYRISSQSGVLALAATLGRPTVVTDVGGLPELGTVVVPPDDPVALAGGILRALHMRPGPRADNDLGPFLAAYGLVPVP